MGFQRPAGNTGTAFLAFVTIFHCRNKFFTMRMVKTATGCPEQQSLEVSRARLDGVWSNLGSAALPAGQPPSRWGSLSSEPCSIPGMHIPALGKGDLSISLVGYCWFVLWLLSVPQQSPVVLGSSSSKSTENFRNFRVAVSLLLQFTPITITPHKTVVLLSHLYPNRFHSSLEM